MRDEPSVPRPFNARSLSRHDLSGFKQLFGTYLDIQKNLDIEDLEEDEVKGRWKSFIGKWYDMSSIYSYASYNLEKEKLTS